MTIVITKTWTPTKEIISGCLWLNEIGSVERQLKGGLGVLPQENFDIIIAVRWLLIGYLFKQDYGLNYFFNSYDRLLFLFNTS